jgi:hypothetical protein
VQELFAQLENNATGDEPKYEKTDMKKYINDFKSFIDSSSATKSVPVQDMF